VFSSQIARIGAVLAGALVMAVMQAQTPSPSANMSLLQQSLQKSVLIEGHQPFHLVLEIAPDTTPRAHARPVPSFMNGKVELFWAGRSHYKLVLNSPEFRQTRVVDGDQVEEHDDGDFYPRWLDDFVRMLLNPVPRPQVPKLIQQRLTGGGTFALPGRTAISMPRCLETSDRPAGITEETSIARVCFDASHSWYQGTLDFTRYVSLADYAPFGGQMIPRIWSDDIPENIFVEGKVTLLEKLSAGDLKAIYVSSPTPPKEQIRTVFLSRKEIGDRIANVPDYEWPPNDGVLEGYMIVYVRTDRTGQVRESYWDSSDNYGLQDAGATLALKSSLKPMLVEGAAVQMEGPLVLHFKTNRLSSPSAGATY
jgi:hypothetical protein